MNKLKLIKLAVCIMTFLLIFGMLAALGIVYGRISNKPVRTDISLSQPAGSYIADYRIADTNIYILIKGGKTPDRLAVVDSSSARPLFIKIN